MPPSTGMSAPVMKSDALLERNAAMPARSSGVPTRPAAVLAMMRDRSSLLFIRPWVNAVSIRPVQIVLTWMLSFAHADAQFLLNCTMAPLADPYAVQRGPPKYEAAEPMLMILPPPAFFISGYAS